MTLLNQHSNVRFDNRKAFGTLGPITKNFERIFVVQEGNNYKSINKSALKTYYVTFKTLVMSDIILP